MTKDKKFDVLNSIKVLVTPWEKGFTCGIVMDSKAKMSTEQYELCSTIKGMPINSIAEFDREDNVIDFIEYLKKKRDKELN